MKGNFQSCLAITLRWEGGFSDNPNDPGGPTNFGIIQSEYNKFRISKDLPIQSVRGIAKDEYTEIYLNNYWNVMGCDDLPLGYDLCVFDFAVNSGPARAKIYEAGFKTIDTFQMARRAFLQSLGRLWLVFGAGWGKRVAGIKLQAHQMVTQAAAQTVATLTQVVYT